MDESSEAVPGDVLAPQAVESLLDLLGGDADALVEVMDAFLEEAPARIAEAEDGIIRGDMVLAARAAHTLKSNALTFGANDLAAVSRQLEDAARAGDRAVARATVAALGSEWALTRAALCDLRDRTTR